MIIFGSLFQSADNPGTQQTCSGREGAKQGQRTGRRDGPDGCGRAPCSGVGLQDVERAPAMPGRRQLASHSHQGHPGFFLTLPSFISGISQQFLGFLGMILRLLKDKTGSFLKTWAQVKKSLAPELPRGNLPGPYSSSQPRTHYPPPRSLCSSGCPCPNTSVLIAQ